MSSYQRRDLLVASAALTALAASGDAVSAVSTPAQLVHHVFFWLKNPQSKADLARLLEGLRTLARIETVRGIHIGVPADTESRDVIDSTYSASELLFFDDVAGQDAYQVHPVHKQFVAECSHLWERVVVYDSVAAP